MASNTNSLKQYDDVLLAIGPHFGYDIRFNDARTAKARRFKFVKFVEQADIEKFKPIEEKIRNSLTEANVNFLNVFFAPNSPNSKRHGMVLHVIVPNLDTK